MKLWVQDNRQLATAMATLPTLQYEQQLPIASPAKDQIQTVLS